MQLKIEVQKFHGQVPKEPNSAIFDERGGSLGRQSKNHPEARETHLELPDPDCPACRITREHALIIYEAHSFYIQDNSANGTYIFRQGEAIEMEKGDKVRLADQDRIGIPSIEPIDYELVVHFIEAKEPSEFHIRNINDLFGKEKSIDKPREQGKGADIHREVWHTFLRGAGIEDVNAFGDENIIANMQLAGKTFRVLIDGLRAFLKVRKDLRSEFGVPLTTMSPVNNNPLKADLSFDEAMKRMFNKDQLRFLDAIDAVNEGLTDIQIHQTAFAEGVKASLNQVIEKFAPQRILSKYNEGFILQKKAKCWDAYNESYPQIAQEAKEQFFRDAFIRAYEAHSSELNAKKKR